MPSSKAFWRKAIILLGLLLAAAAYLELGLRHMPTLYHQKRDGLRAAAATAQVLVLGASQANQGLDPALWPVSAFNAAAVGQDAYYDEALFQRWAPQMSALKAVVLPISIVSLDASLADTQETWRSFAYSQAFGIPNEMPARRWDLRNWSALALSEPWPALRLACQGFVDPQGVRLSVLGFESTPALGSDDIDLRLNSLTAGKRVRYHLSLKKAERLAGNLELYRSLAGSARARGIAPLFVIFPVDVSYAQALSEAAKKERAQQLRELAGPLQAPIFDYFSDPRFTSADFADVDHLSGKGAKKFSAILWTEALGPLFKR